MGAALGSALATGSLTGGFAAWPLGSSLATLSYLLLFALEAALDGLRTKVVRVYVHLDLVVLDPERVGKANGFVPEGGLSAEELQTALGTVRERFVVSATGIASYDPSFDEDGRVLDEALACVRLLTSPAMSAA